jgi:hypothetical protein
MTVREEWLRVELALARAMPEEQQMVALRIIVVTSPFHQQPARRWPPAKNPYTLPHDVLLSHFSECVALC